jgi:hypothetical protein
VPAHLLHCCASTTPLTRCTACCQYISCRWCSCQLSLHARPFSWDQPTVVDVCHNNQLNLPVCCLPTVKLAAPICTGMDWHCRCLRAAIVASWAKTASDCSSQECHQPKLSHSLSFLIPPAPPFAASSRQRLACCTIAGAPGCRAAGAFELRGWCRCC